MTTRASSIAAPPTSPIVTPRSILANRVSHTLGLAGPSFTVDAAQSSSLVAVHLACESLLREESEFALAGGVHLNLDPQTADRMSRFGALSPDGRCYTFDERANGIRSEEHTSELQSH